MLSEMLLRQIAVPLSFSVAVLVYAAVKLTAREYDRPRWWVRAYAMGGLAGAVSYLSIYQLGARVLLHTALVGFGIALTLLISEGIAENEDLVEPPAGVPPVDQRLQGQEVDQS